MNPESTAWKSLREHASSRLRPGFADRVLRAARAGAEAAPSVLSQCFLGAATAVLCFGAVALFQSGRSGVDRDRSLADWQKVASDTGEAGLGQ